MPYTFTPPTIEEGPIGEHRLFQFFKQSRGVSVLRFGEDVFEVRYPSEDDIAEADEAWLGGSSYTISDASAQILINEGYEDYITAL